MVYCTLGSISTGTGNCAFFARESPRYLYSWGTTQNAAVIASWAPLKIRQEGLKIESPGPQNGELLLATKIALQFPALHDGRSSLL